MNSKLFSELVASIKQAGKIKKKSRLTKLFVLLVSGPAVAALFQFVIWLGYSIETAGLITLPALIIFMLMLGLLYDF